MSAADAAAAPLPRTPEPAGARVRGAFAERFGGLPSLVVRAPGRVNLLGEHTDYNQGFVLPMAIEQAVWIALRPRADGRVRLRSLDLDDERTVELARPQPSGCWIEYANGVAFVLGRAGLPLHGFDGVLAGDIPMGAGLSSSAALGVGLARAFCALAGVAWEPLQAAGWAQSAENDWVGVRCGIMDPLISAAGRAGHALLVDCRNLALRPVWLPAGVVVAVLDTGTRRDLVDSAYNERRRRCEAAAAGLGVGSLRELGEGELERRGAALPPEVFAAARHVLGENARTLAAAAALERRDPAAAGALMRDGHRSLRDDLCVSGEALDAIVQAALEAPGCYGARMTGAGFAGCAVALVEEAQAEAFRLALQEGYRRRSQREALVHLCHAADGASTEPVA